MAAGDASRTIRTSASAALAERTRDADAERTDAGSGCGNTTVDPPAASFVHAVRMVALRCSIRTTTDSTSASSPLTDGPTRSTFRDPGLEAVSRLVSV